MKKIIIGILVVLVITLSMVFFFQKDKGFEFDQAAKDGEFLVQDPTLMQSLQEKVDASNFRLQINSNPQIDSETLRGNLMVSNSDENANDIYVEIYLEESNEIIYQSKRLAPGERVVYDNITAPLEIGSYSAIAVFNLLDDDSEEVVGQLEAVLNLEIVDGSSEESIAQ